MMDPSNLISVFRPEYGWVVTLLYLWLEIRSPWGRVESLLTDIGKVITVVRALARVHDDEIAVEKVDRYLVEDGREPGDFIADPASPNRLMHPRESDKGKHDSDGDEPR